MGEILKWAVFSCDDLHLFPSILQTVCGICFLFSTLRRKKRDKWLTLGGFIIIRSALISYVIITLMTEVTHGSVA